jgi:hypothetical protein
MTPHRQKKPSSAVGIVGGVVCLGGLMVFLVLLMTGVISTEPRSPQTPATPGQAPVKPGGGGPTAPGEIAPSAPSGQPLPKGAPGEVRVRFSGKYDAAGDTRKVAYLCPFCSVELLDVAIPHCPSCNRPLSWPRVVSCGFCKGTGVCEVCGGDKKCVVCSKGGRMLMGVRPPCAACRNSGACQACAESGKCQRCQEGQFPVTARPASTRPASSEPPRPTPAEAPPAPQPAPAEPAPSQE